jgi:gluconokinase
VFGYDVVVPQVYEGSGFGAAVLAMVAVGQLGQLEDVDTLIRTGDRYHPNLNHTQRYRQLFAIYDRLYHSNVNDFSLLNQLR